jgi:hypothetical protein
MPQHPGHSLLKVTLFAAINQLALASDPRSVGPTSEMIKSITETLMFARSHDPVWAAELEEWVTTTLKLIARAGM